MVVRLTDAWTEILRRRESNSATGAYPQPVRELLGEMVAAGALMQSNIKFDGALILQIFGYRKDTPAEPWNALVAGLPVLEEVVV